MPQYRAEIGFWLRCYDTITVEAENDAEAVEKAKAAALKAMESHKTPESFDTETRREGLIISLDRENDKGELKEVAEDVEFDDDKIHP